jgi:hypothetical protein
MMDLSPGTLIQLVANVGFAGIVLVVWYFDMRLQKRILDQYRDDMQRSMDQYRTDMQHILKQHERELEEMRRMYEEGLREARGNYDSNVTLVRCYEGLSRDLKDTLLWAGQGYQKLADNIERNVYCPMVRISKDAKGPQ